MISSRLTGSLGKMIKHPYFLDNNTTSNVDMSECDRCGMCCMVTSNLFLSDEEVKRIKEYMRHNNIQPHTHKEKLSVVVSMEKISSLKADALQYQMDRKPCPLYKPGHGCMVYQVRPLICRIYQCWDAVGFMDVRAVGLTSHHSVRNMEHEIFS